MATADCLEIVVRNAFSVNYEWGDKLLFLWWLI